MSEPTIFIRERPAGWGVVVKPLLRGANNLGPLTHDEAAAYAETLREAHGFPVVDEAETGS